ncbi:MAG: hypothetical protein FWC16_05380 [Defluviitaleaceae bacterium]|nr:hypothetical protein [Defluviitaleaceae bacterium]MCL2274340.1 hypothetical protein [Defluviitaleaceae bacterium]
MKPIIETGWAAANCSCGPNCRCSGCGTPPIVRPPVVTDPPGSWCNEIILSAPDLDI